jgi:hypothetical protein
MIGSGAAKRDFIGAFRLRSSRILIGLISL